MKDSGIGLESKDVKSVFEPYKQVRKATKDKEGGLGLGLSICNEIMAEHKGNIWVESEGLNKGCTYEFTLKSLPLRKDLPVIAIKERATTDFSNKRILLVDDDEATLMLTQVYLAKLGFKTITASNFSHAKRIDPELIDIVVSDFNLGDGNG